MAWFDLDGFLASLPPRGVDVAHVPLYREAAEALLASAGEGRFGAAMLDDALARETMAGASARRLANLRRVGDAMIEYVGQGAKTIVGTGPAAASSPASPLTGAAGAAAVIAAPSALPPVELDLAIEVPRRTAASTREPINRGAARASAPPPVFTAPPRPGCICRARHDVYLDDYWQDIGTMYLGFMTITGGVAWRFAPAFTWLIVTSGLLAAGALITGLTVGWRCDDCRRWIAGRDLDADERSQVRRRALIFLGIAAALAVVCALSVRAARAAWRTEPVPRIELPE